MTLKFNGLKTKKKYSCAVLNFELFFSKVRKYENRYHTKICDFVCTTCCASKLQPLQRCRTGGKTSLVLDTVFGHALEKE